MLKRIIFFAIACVLLAGIDTSSHAQISVPASVRRERTPLQFSFGPWTAISPFTNITGYTTITVDNQIFPSNLVTLTNNFSSTGSFTQTDYTGGGLETFTVASNVGTVATAGGQHNIFVDTSTSFTGPSLMVRMTVEQNGTATSGTFDNAGPGIFKDGSNFVDFEWDHRNNLAVFHIRIAGTDTTANTSCTLPLAPWTEGFSLNNNNAFAWVKNASGTTLCASRTGITQYDFTTDGNLTGWHPGFVVRGASASTWKFSNLQAGSVGAAGVRDPHIVTYPDGRPYIQGSKVFFTATDQYGGWSTWSLDLSNNTLARLGQIFSDRGGHTYADAAGHLVYDPANGIYRAMVPSWGSATGNNPNIFYGTASISTNDLLSAGSHVVSPMTQMTFGIGSNIGWDPFLTCDEWNYSTSSCPHWLLAYTTTTATFNPALFTSTSDPSANTWTEVAAPLDTGYEGSTIIRTATTNGSSGVTYVAAFGGQSNGIPRSSKVYSVSSMSLLGSINVMWPAVNQQTGGENAAWPMMFAYGNKEYILSFDSTQFGSATSGTTMGNLVISTAPKYSTANNWPSYKDGDSVFSGSTSVASETSKSFTVATGDLLVVACRGANNSTASVTVTSSPSNTWTALGMNTTGSGFTNGYYTFATASGATTVTCTPNVSNQFLGLTVSQYSPGFLTSADFTGYSNITGSNVGTYTSGTFSTTAKGLIVACPDALFGAAAFRPSLIGPYAAVNIIGQASGAAPCEATLTEAAQTGITASMAAGNTSTGHWGGAILTFK